MSALEIRRLSPGLENLARDLLAEVAADAGGRFFTPHPFSAECIADLANRPGLDLYYLLVDSQGALAYGLLRGWEQGYEVPSLGLAVSPSARGHGLGLLMMEFLHAAARHKGARQIRLRVHTENQRAIGLYRACGYQFETDPDLDTGLLVGTLDIVRG